MLTQLLTTFSDRDSALRLARELVDRRLAACVQVIDPVTSVYRWKGAVHEERETLCLMKVPEERLAPLVAYVRDHHPYDTPELTVVPSSFVDERYLAWAERETSPAG
ncbi:MAG: divalent-cation tolerance protein CutA [Actinomycetota bacterium]